MKPDLAGLHDLIDDYTDDLSKFFEALAEVVESASTNARLYKMLVSLEIAAAMVPLTVRLAMRGMLDKPIAEGVTTTFLDLVETADVRVYKTRGTNPEKHAANIAARARTAIPGNLADDILQFIERFMSDDLFRQQLKGEVYGANEGAQFILLEWDGHERALDHVLAQDPTFSGGRGFRDQTHYLEQLHRLGNLTLVEKRINSAAQQKTPEQKANEDKLYKASDYASTRSLGADINALTARGKMFGAHDVELRTTRLVDFCLARWPLIRS